MIVGGGKVGFEKIIFLLKSSPNANIVVVAEIYIDGFSDIDSSFNAEKVISSYNNSFLKDKHIVILLQIKMGHIKNVGIKHIV